MSNANTRFSNLGNQSAPNQRHIDAAADVSDHAEDNHTVVKTFHNNSNNKNYGDRNNNNNAAGRMFHFPASMNLAAVRDPQVRKLIQEEAALREQLEEAKEAHRVTSNEKDKLLAVRSEESSASSAAQATLNQKLDAARTKRDDLKDEMDRLKIQQHEISQGKDRIRLLDFDITNFGKELYEAEKKFEEAKRSRDSYLRQSQEALRDAEYQTVADVDAALEKNANEIQRATNQQNITLVNGLNKQRANLERAKKVVTSAQQLLDKSVAEGNRAAQLEVQVSLKAKQKQTTEEHLRDLKLKMSVPPAQLNAMFDETRKKLMAVNKEMDDIMANKRDMQSGKGNNASGPQSAANQELDRIMKLLNAQRQTRDDLNKKLDDVRKAFPFTSFKIDPQYRSEFVGKGLATLTQLQEDYGVAINMDSGSARDNSEAWLLGNAADTEQCIEAMKAIMKAAEDARQTLTVSYDPQLTRQLIGTRGSNIEKLQSNSGATLKINEAAGEIVVTGSLDAIQTAKALIEEFLNQSARAEIEFDPKLLNIVIGKGGATVRKIQEDSGAKAIRIPREENKIQISGSRDAVEKAKAMYEELIGNMSSNAYTMRIDPKLIRLVIGPKGATIRELQESTGAVINCGEGTVSIRGSQDAVAAARRFIEDLSRREDIRVAVPLCMHEFFTTASVVPSEAPADGTAVQPITPLEFVQKITSCEQVQLSREGTAVYVKGRREAVRQAQTMVERMLLDNVKQVAVPEALFDHFTSRSGDESKSLLARIQDNTPGVALSLSRGAGAIFLSGRNQDAVQATIELLREQIRGFEKNIRRITIPVGRSGSVIGAGGRVIMAIQEKTGCQVTVQKENNIVVVYREDGNEQALEQAIQEVTAAAAVVPRGEGSGFDRPMYGGGGRGGGSGGRGGGGRSGDGGFYGGPRRTA